MPIYSKNRSGSMALATTEAAKGYDMNNGGRVLYETVMNEKTLLDAMIANDMNEIKGLKEGTILESEITALNEASARELVNKIKQGILKFWEKLKQIFKDAMNKISAYVLGDCKAFAAEFEKAKEKYKDSKATIDGTFPKVDYELAVKLDPTPIIGSRMAKIRYNQEVEINSSAIISEELGKIAGAGFALTPEKFNEYVFDKLVSEERKNVKVSDDIVTKMLAKCKTGLKESIARIKNAQSNAEKAVKDLMDLQDDMLKGNEKTYEANYQKLVSLTNIAQQYISITCTTAIKVERYKFSASRKALGALMAAMRSEAHDIKKSEKAAAKEAKKSEKAAKKEKTAEDVKSEAVLAALVEASIELDNAFCEGTIEVSDEVREFIESVNPDEVLA